MAGCTLHPCDTGFEQVSRGPGPTPGMEEEKQLLGSLDGKGAGATGLWVSGARQAGPRVPDR